MKFLLDVNASAIVARWLTNMGHDVAQVAEKDPRMRDEAILTWAVNERRIIVTTDQDFEEMIWRERRPHCGVLRLENLPRAERKALFVGRCAGTPQPGARIRSDYHRPEHENPHPKTTRSGIISGQ